MVSKWYHGNVGTPFEVSRMPMLYQKYVGHDNNRDGYMNNVIESRVVTKATVERWHPMVFYNHHQTAPFPTRIWIPPFAEPISSNVHPLMWRWINVFGTAMASYLDQHGMPGSVHRGRGFDDWYPGFIDGVNNYRNTISFLTETALYRYATPHFYTVNDFPEQYRDLRKQVFYSSPWEGGWWRLRDAVNYMIGASMSVLDTSAKYKEELIYTRYRAGRDVIERFRKEPPFAYVIPREQHDPQTAALLVEKLKINGIKIGQASQTLSVHGRDYPAGSWVVMMDQPFALLVKELFGIQKYPDLRETPGGDPDLPYDTAGWTLPIQMGVEVAAMNEPLEPGFRDKIIPLEEIAPPPGTLQGSGDHFVFGHQSNVSLTAVNRIHKAGGRVSMANKAMSIGNENFPAGTFIARGISRDQMQTIGSELALKVTAARNIGDTMTAIRAPRIGIYSPWAASIDEGWVRWLLDQHEFPYARLRNGDIQAGRLRDNYDVLVIAEMRQRAIMEGSQVGTVPPEYAGGIGETGLVQLRQFVHTGGTLITLGNSSLFAIEKFNLPVTNALQGLRNRDFFCSGSLLRTIPNQDGHPILYGLKHSPAIFFSRNAAFETKRGFKGSVLLTYPKEDNPLLSGYILNPEKIQGKIAALDVAYDQGRIILTGFRPHWRGQAFGMFKFLFNSLFYFGDVPASVTPKPSAPAGMEGEWADLTKSIQTDLGKAFEQNQKFAAASGSRAAQEAKQLDALLQQFQTSHFAMIDDLKSRAPSRTASIQLDEYKTQLKAALIDMRGKDYGAVKFGVSDLKRQFRLTTLEKEITDLLRSP
jgi:hypothetical protein